MNRWVSVRVRGRVQGVGFRWATLARARELGLAGWVRNCRDGAVEIHAGGSTESVERFLAWCASGPSGARVDEVVVAYAAPGDMAAPFEIRY